MRRSVFVATLLLALPAIAGGDNLPKGLLALEGYPAPALELPDTEGEIYSLREARGHWAFVHFWASWCGPCRREMPAIQALVQDMRDTSLEFVLVNTAEDGDTIWSFLASVAPELSTLMDPTGEVTAAWQPRGLPATYLVDPDGIVRYQALGGRPWNDPPYREFLEMLLEGQAGTGSIKGSTEPPKQSDRRLPDK